MIANYPKNPASKYSKFPMKWKANHYCATDSTKEKEYFQ